MVAGRRARGPDPAGHRPPGGRVARRPAAPLPQPGRPAGRPRRRRLRPASSTTIDDVLAAARPRGAPPAAPSCRPGSGWRWRRPAYIRFARSEPGVYSVMFRPSARHHRPEYVGQGFAAFAAAPGPRRGRPGATAGGPTSTAPSWPPCTGPTSTAWPTCGCTVRSVAVVASARRRSGCPCCPRPSGSSSASTTPWPRPPSPATPENPPGHRHVHVPRRQLRPGRPRRSPRIDLPVTGTIPAELTGRLLRIGPNPVTSPTRPRTTGSWATAWSTGCACATAGPSGTATACAR